MEAGCWELLHDPCALYDTFVGSVHKKSKIDQYSSLDLFSNSIFREKKVLPFIQNHSVNQKKGDELTCPIPNYQLPSKQFSLDLDMCLQFL